MQDRDHAVVRRSVARRHRGLESGAIREDRRAGVHWGRRLKEDLAAMPRFLSRFLALPVAEQSRLFAELEGHRAVDAEQATKAGVETAAADSLAIACGETLYEHPGTGIKLAEIARRDKLVTAGRVS